MKQKILKQLAQIPFGFLLGIIMGVIYLAMTAEVCKITT